MTKKVYINQPSIFKHDYDEEMRRLGRELAKDPEDPKISIAEALSILQEHLNLQYSAPGTRWRSTLRTAIEALKEKLQREEQ